MNYLVKKGELPKEMFTAKGYGETRRIADESTEEGKEKNRRVEFNIVEQDVTKKKVEIDPDRLARRRSSRSRRRRSPTRSPRDLRPRRWPPLALPVPPAAPVARTAAKDARKKGPRTCVSPRSSAPSRSLAATASRLLRRQARRRDLPRRHAHAARDQEQRGEGLLRPGPGRRPERQQRGPGPLQGREEDQASCSTIVAVDPTGTQAPESLQQCIVRTNDGLVLDPVDRRERASPVQGYTFGANPHEAAVTAGLWGRCGLRAPSGPRFVSGADL